jgi:hypothetical protein
MATNVNEVVVKNDRGLSDGTGSGNMFDLGTDL